jgi:hypothetical protein
MMTLKELQRRIDDLVDANRRNGWLERNDLPVLIEERRSTKRNLRRYVPVAFVRSGQFSIGNQHFACTLHANASEEIKSNCRCRKAKTHRACAYCGVGTSEICGVCHAAGIDGPVIRGTERVICAEHKGKKSAA